MACLGLKRDTICVYLNFDEFSDDKSRWVDIANFIGEIRSRIIPNYTNQGGLISVSTRDPAEKLRVQKLVEENDRKEITNRCQQVLRSKNWELTSFLFHNTPNGAQKDAKFVEAVSSAAHLTKEEIKDLKKRE
jgi:hypothetical protein